MIMRLFARFTPPATLAIASLLVSGCGSQASMDDRHDRLKVVHMGEHDEVEIGSRYVGLELLHGSPLLNRISFYYPVANSVDLTRDYWRRGDYKPLFLGLRAGDAEKEWLGLEPWRYELTPYSVSYSRYDETKAVTVSYDLMATSPAFSLEIVVRNLTDHPLPVELYTHLEATQRTSHTYAVKDSAWTEYDEAGATIYVSHDAPETGPNQLFVTNAGELPASFSTRSRTLGEAGSVPEWWVMHDSELPEELIPRGEIDLPAAAFQYLKVLEPGSTLEVRQLIGSTRSGEAPRVAEAVRASYRDEISDYRATILDAAYSSGNLRTSDPALDHSVRWARAILEANVHHLEGSFVPMPAPAEYNFYFTHDVLLTDLAAVHFDQSRVRRDLEYIVAHASDERIIPHAYYWKDDSYRTEWAAPDSWNHLWFVIVASSYLRHSGDTVTAQRLYPFMEKSLSLAMSNRQDDGLLWAERPDWWDIGHVRGPRAYVSILAFRALRDFAFTSFALGRKAAAELKEVEDAASGLRAALTERLWDDELGYLLNVNPGGEVDRHLYSGSLLAAHYGVLDSARTARLVETAGRHLLDERIGLYNAYPMDFHERIEEYGFSGGEAGAKHYYFNGGVWPHGNAWYALGLIAADRRADALDFIKRVMTLEGVIDSPNGQPAMYEFRNTDSGNPDAYGQVDKPQFTWAAAWYQYALYRLFGVRENGWNVALEPWLPEGVREIDYGLTVGGRPARVRVSGSGSRIKRFLVDGEPRSSAVLPRSEPASRIEVELGEVTVPYIASTAALLMGSEYDRQANHLSVVLSAFPGHSNETRIVSPSRPVSVVHNGMPLDSGWSVTTAGEAGERGRAYGTRIRFTHDSESDTLVVRF